MSTLEGLKGSCEIQKDRYGKNTLLSIPVETIERLLAMVDVGERLKKYGKAGEGYTLAYDAAVKAWDKSKAEL